MLIYDTFLNKKIDKLHIYLIISNINNYNIGNRSNVFLFFIDTILNYL